ncbi:MAG: hypothetical protein KGJ78_01560 [Alphaproteobacteria bacterium]|nr:hypothetical protein [Alphaproteobacteria bacterium]
MRLICRAIAAFFCLSNIAHAWASPATVNELQLPPAGGINTYAAANHDAGQLPVVTRGGSLGVACAEADRTGADVRVVMHVLPDAAPPGFAAVLATEQTIDHGTVHVRVPNLPDLSHHTVSVKVYVMDSKGTHTCDAGRVRIG